MSKENELTIGVYQKYADRYLQNSIAHDAVNVEKAKEKQELLQELLRVGLSTLPRHSAVLEIGSGDGVTASYLEELGFDVTASDVADAFLAEIKKKKLRAIRFNVLTDLFPKKYYGIVCWRVFVHFTSMDARMMLKNAYDALEPGGRLVFNAMNREEHTENEEWLDFQGAYHMGATRFFHYFDEAELREMATLIGYRISDFRREGGTRGNKWLVFVLER